MSKNDKDELLAAARRAKGNAYAPYSGFHVGAAVRDNKGRIHNGVNVENAAYPQGLCAEAAAIAAMVLAGGTSIAAIAVVGSGGVLCTPCGGCRQRIREFAAPQVPVIIGDDDGVAGEFTLGELLPHDFGPNNLI